MSGIECINLLAFIQFIIAFDFGLYYLDNKHVLTEIYRKYQKDLKLSVRAVLSRANDIITESLKSENSECILNSAYLDKAYRRLKYLTDENQLDLELWFHRIICWIIRFLMLVLYRDVWVST